MAAETTNLASSLTFYLICLMKIGTYCAPSASVRWLFHATKQRYQEVVEKYGINWSECRIVLIICSFVAPLYHFSISYLRPSHFSNRMFFLVPCRDTKCKLLICVVYMKYPVGAPFSGYYCNIQNLKKINK